MWVFERSLSWEYLDKNHYQNGSHVYNGNFVPLKSYLCTFNWRTSKLEKSTWLSPLSTERRPLRDQNLARSLSSLQDPPKSCLCGNAMEILEGPLRDQKFNFQQISWRSPETAEHSLRDQQQPCFLAETIDNSLSVLCALSERPTEISDRPTEISERLAKIFERPARTNGDYWMTKRVHQNVVLLKESWEIIEKLVRPLTLVERSLSVHWKFASLKDHWETVLN